MANPFDLASQLFLCPFDVEEGEDDGLPAEAVRLDEVMGGPGDALAYVYDYGDSWELTLTLEEVGPADSSTPAAALVDGERAAPPEDSGGAVDEASLAELVDDPASVDLDQIRESLASPWLAIHDLGLRPDLVSLVVPLGFDSPDLVTMAARVVDDAHEQPSPEAVRAALSPVVAFLDQASGDGIRLTAAGYVPPAVVEALRPHVPGMRDWIGVSNVEIDARPVLHLRQTLQKVGLLRKFRGRLVLSRAAATARGDLDALWSLLAVRLVPGGPREFDHDATLLALLHLAQGPGDLPYDRVARDLTRLGYAAGHGSRRTPVDGRHVREVPGLEVLLALDEESPHRHRWAWCGPVGAALARAALRATGR